MASVTRTTTMNDDNQLLQEIKQQEQQQVLATGNTIDIDDSDVAAFNRSDTGSNALEACRQVYISYRAHII